MGENPCLLGPEPVKDEFFVLRRRKVNQAVQPATRSINATCVGVFEQ